MRLPTDGEGADEDYRERLMALLYTPIMGTASADLIRTSPAPQALESSNKTNFSNASLTTSGSGDETIAATTVGGGGRSG